MGTLIVFIALILVAAVAAGVLISTTGALQNKALATGKATTAQVGTSLEVVEIFGEDGTTNNSIDNIYLTAKLTSGSDDMRFQDLLLTLNLINMSTDLVYNSSLNCSNATALAAATGEYGVRYQIAANVGHLAGYLVKGDVAQICVRSPQSIREGEAIRMTVIPRVGTPVAIEMRTPDLMTNRRVTIFP